jgi:hypothetical protein
MALYKTMNGEFIPRKMMERREPVIRANHGCSLEELEKDAGLSWAELYLVFQNIDMKSVREGRKIHMTESFTDWRSTVMVIIEQWVEREIRHWHEGDSVDRLHVHLGLTQEEYARYVEAGSWEKASVQGEDNA